ncbi:MAG: DUF4347 domain-containing protein [Inquilinus sp.]|nr:DUF4347 domain-containing protein [Inquilinus sp.]
MAPPAYRYHLHSDIPGKFSLSTVHDARAHAGDSLDIAKPLKCTDDLIELFQEWVRIGERVESLDFHTHGAPGSIKLGDDRLSWGTPDFQRLEDTGVRKVFTPGCPIVFRGCDVAEGPRGEAFVAEIGRTWLSAHGGTVTGSTGKGLMDPFGWLSPERVWHPLGTWVTATVAAGGAATLSGHSLLHPNRLREVAARLEPLVRSMPETSPAIPLLPPGGLGEWFLPDGPHVVASGAHMEQLIDKVWELLGRGRDDRPNYADIADAYIFLSVIAERVRPL